ncbi:MAG: helix-turn-helix transcriptional regulator [Sciscionella sp.]|nr:helix-turn-helix transcriptional regulator [Sciscionella sp.]
MPGAAATRLADQVSPSSPPLSRLLSTGPFPDALRAAISASGLSLDRIQHRLLMRGARVSVATLSYWQSGRRRPERPESLRALRQLESVLGLPGSALSSLLGPPRPRGRRDRTAGLPPIHSMWARPQRVAQLLSGLDTSTDPLLTRLSQHDRCTTKDDGTQVLDTRLVLRAEQDGIDRIVLVHGWGNRADDTRLAGQDDHCGNGTNAGQPNLTELRNCRLGQLAMDQRFGMFAAELIFDRPLSWGETTIVEYRLRGPATFDGDCFLHSGRFRMPVREYVVEVRFDHGGLPAQCQKFSRPADRSHLPRSTNVRVGPSGDAHAVWLDLEPGEFGVRWAVERSSP